MGIADIRKPAVKNIQVTTADSVRIELRFKQAGVLIDVSQYDGTVAPIIDPVTEVQLDEWAVDLTSASAGVIVLTLTVTQTTALCPCEAVWYCQLIDTSAAETNTHTVVAGDFVVLKRRGFGG